ncbi:hypothetical protein PanWU01x14_030270 [Parasponia andersonii]|uniref:Uncharacterized protein n=1 Tax=Parasponia andersonii TaxID=3476 RepID=A0A2P5DUQ1_PARAD|nr:hypothetical protein PanWU01x14_030270 [Parasponia andersonii]
MCYVIIVSYIISCVMQYFLQQKDTQKLKYTIIENNKKNQNTSSKPTRKCKVHLFLTKAFQEFGMCSKIFSKILNTDTISTVIQPKKKKQFINELNKTPQTYSQIYSHKDCRLWKVIAS